MYVVLYVHVYTCTQHQRVARLPACLPACLPRKFFCAATSTDASPHTYTVRPHGQVTAPTTHSNRIRTTSQLSRSPPRHTNQAEATQQPLHKALPPRCRAHNARTSAHSTAAPARTSHSHSLPRCLPPCVCVCVCVCDNATLGRSVLGKLFGPAHTSILEYHARAYARTNTRARAVGVLE